ncbi:probable 39S ribosomal protein L45, mitochondrial [Penaeus japonicus]|uniref:probable 39S ribosomal protein L45, mitochondrial n=1 Tax=Penaeus japonicus TaxID=27405 RepID=UPI001C714510|nr:probable 39S ribosomal protein L45, mitochondrial [Penaeus japonicus]
MALNLLTKFRALSLCSPGSSSAAITISRGYYVYKDDNYKTIPARFNFKRKNYVEKFKRDRKLKFIKIELPDLNEEKDVRKMTPDEIRAKMKEKGVQPVRPWMEKPVFISSTGATFEPYVPPEGDGKVSVTSAAGAKQKFEFLEKKGKSMMAVRKIRQFDEDFDPKVFAEEAQQIYVDLHKNLADFDKGKLHQLVTERAFPMVTHQVRNKTLRWQFVSSLEPPRVVHARCTDVVTKENIFAQVTVRFHTKQTLAVYDRFGRLQHGSEVVAKDVLEYVVFEKHIANSYGIWRIHDKIIPDWMPPRQPSIRTYQVEEPAAEETSVAVVEENQGKVAETAAA